MNNLSPKSLPKVLVLLYLLFAPQAGYAASKAVVQAQAYFLRHKTSAQKFAGSSYLLKLEDAQKEKTKQFVSGLKDDYQQRLLDTGKESARRLKVIQSDLKNKGSAKLQTLTRNSGLQKLADNLKPRLKIYHQNQKKTLSALSETDLKATVPNLTSDISASIQARMGALDSKVSARQDWQTLRSDLDRQFQLFQNALSARDQIKALEGQLDIPTPRSIQFEKSWGQTLDTFKQDIGNLERYLSDTEKKAELEELRLLVRQSIGSEKDLTDRKHSVGFEADWDRYIKELKVISPQLGGIWRDLQEIPGQRQIGSLKALENLSSEISNYVQSHGGSLEALKSQDWKQIKTDLERQLGAAKDSMAKETYNFEIQGDINPGSLENSLESLKQKYLDIKHSLQEDADIQYFKKLHSLLDEGQAKESRYGFDGYTKEFEKIIDKVKELEGAQKDLSSLYESNNQHLKKFYREELKPRLKTYRDSQKEILRQITRGENGNLNELNGLTSEISKFIKDRAKDVDYDSFKDKDWVQIKNDLKSQLESIGRDIKENGKHEGVESFTYALGSENETDGLPQSLEVLQKEIRSLENYLQENGHDSALHELRDLIHHYWSDQSDLLRKEGELAVKDLNQALDKYIDEIKSLKEQIKEPLEDIKDNFDELRSSWDFNDRTELAWGEGDRALLDLDERLAEVVYAGNYAGLKLGSEGFLHLRNIDGNFELKALAPKGGRLPLETFHYADGWGTVNLSSTYLKLDVDHRRLGIYGSEGRYLLEVITDDPDAMQDQVQQTAKAVWEKEIPLKESYIPLIKDTIQEVRINPRELVKGGRVSFRDERWNKLMTALAWDMENISITDTQLVEIIESKNSSERLYKTLEAALPRSLSEELEQKEKTLLYDLGTSILEPSSSSSNSFMPAFSSSSSSFNFNSSALASAPVGNYTQVGYDIGVMDFYTPLLGQYSRTGIGGSTLAERYYAHVNSEVFSSNYVSLNIDGLMYAYRLPEDFGLSLIDNNRSNFSVNNYRNSLWGFEVEQANDLGVIIPGMIIGGTIADPREHWYTSVKMVPYLPVDVDPQTMDIALAGADGSTGLMDQLEYAMDVRTGVKQQFAGQELQLDLGKDVNDYVSIAPSINLFQRLNLGVESKGPEFSQTEQLRYNASLNMFGQVSHMFFEQNLYSKTDTVGTGLERKVGKNTYYVSTAVAQWENQGQTEIVENIFSLGLDVKSKHKFLSSVILNRLYEDVTYQNSCQLSLDKAGYDTLALELNVNDGIYSTEGDVRMWLKFGF